MSAAGRGAPVSERRSLVWARTVAVASAEKMPDATTPACEPMGRRKTTGTQSQAKGPEASHTVVLGVELISSGGLACRDGNGQKNSISISVSIFSGGNRMGFEKYGYGNRIGLRGSTETN